MFPKLFMKEKSYCINKKCTGSSSMLQVYLNCLFCYKQLFGVEPRSEADDFIRLVLRNVCLQCIETDKVIHYFVYV